MTLEELLRFLIETGELSENSHRLPNGGIVLNAPPSLWVQVWNLDPYLSVLEDPQQDRLAELGSPPGFLANFPDTGFDMLRIHLVRLLERYGGWVGIDDGEFEERFEADTLDQIPARFAEWEADFLAIANRSVVTN